MSVSNDKRAQLANVVFDRVTSEVRNSDELQASMVNAAVNLLKLYPVEEEPQGAMELSGTLAKYADQMSKATRKLS